MKVNEFYGWTLLAFCNVMGHCGAITNYSARLAIMASILFISMIKMMEQLPTNEAAGAPGQTHPSQPVFFTLTSFDTSTQLACCVQVAFQLANIYEHRRETSRRRLEAGLYK